MPTTSEGHRAHEPIEETLNSFDNEASVEDVCLESLDILIDGVENTINKAMLQS